MAKFEYSIQEDKASGTRKVFKVDKKTGHAVVIHEDKIEVKTSKTMPPIPKRIQRKIDASA